MGANKRTIARELKWFYVDPYQWNSAQFIWNRQWDSRWQKDKHQQQSQQRNGFEWNHPNELSLSLGLSSLQKLSFHSIFVHFDFATAMAYSHFLFHLLFVPISPSQLFFFQYVLQSTIKWMPFIAHWSDLCSTAIQHGWYVSALSTRSRMTCTHKFSGIKIRISHTNSWFYCTHRIVWDGYTILMPMYMSMAWGCIAKCICTINDGNKTNNLHRHLQDGRRCDGFCRAVWLNLLFDCLFELVAWICTTFQNYFAIEISKWQVFFFKCHEHRTPFRCLLVIKYQ